ncbi:hypothetical protein PIB30_091184 [Stylosanthes scabra]|uniref:Uncharacterized protein n=1 Tax=Stylosanthes scabra TaxID=79078 RepID=A0ABU6XV67_9FABA|nr:hypothetical protein [Stylosanthes scabra]
MSHQLGPFPQPNPKPISANPVTTKTPYSTTQDQNPTQRPTKKNPSNPKPTHATTTSQPQPKPTSNMSVPPIPQPSPEPALNQSQDESMTEEFVPKTAIPEAELEDSVHPEPEPPDLHSIDSAIMIEALKQHEEKANSHNDKDSEMIMQDGEGSPEVKDENA